MTREQFLSFQLQQAVVCGRIALRVQNDKKTWDLREIEQARTDCRAALEIMTEAQKRAALASIAERAAIAERAGLPSTAKSWRELHLNVGCRPAAEIIMTASRGEVPEQE